MSTTTTAPDEARMSLIEDAYRKLARRSRDGQPPNATAIARSYGWTPTWVVAGLRELIAAGRIVDPATIATVARSDRERAGRDERDAFAKALREQDRKARQAEQDAREALREAERARVAAEKERVALEKAERAARKAAMVSAPSSAAPAIPQGRPRRRPSPYERQALRAREWTTTDEAAYQSWRASVPPGVGWLLFDAETPPLLCGGGADAGWEDEG